MGPGEAQRSTGEVLFRGGLGMTATVSGRPPARSAQRVIEGLEAQGVRHIFGVSGAKIDEVYDVLDEQGPELVVCRHEQNAAFIAGAIGRITGEAGVAIATSGPAQPGS